MQENLSVADAFRSAFDSHCAGDLEQAEAIYRAILATDPAQPDTLHYLGILLYQRDGSEQALEMIRQSVALLPDQADWHNDLGNLLAGRGELQQAVESFERAIELSPQDATLWNNLGSVLQRGQMADEAELAFRRAVELAPEFTDALYNLGHLLDEQGRHLDAAEYHCRAFILEPTTDKQKSMLGIAYYKLGRYAEAAEVYRQWLQEEPDNPVAAHFYAACSGNDVPARCSEAYIERTFDDFAERFDAHLQGLSYRAPELMGEVLARMLSADTRLDIVDGGCGTGLGGEILVPYARSLVGIDLSERMLECARQRNIYSALEKADLTAYLNTHPLSFDLVAAADALIYFGDLQPVFAAAHAALRPHGLLLFTVELEEQGSEAFRLNPHGRYSHGQEYLTAALRENGFKVLEMVPGVMRVEFGQPAHGLVVCARKE